MDTSGILNKIAEILEDAKTGVLATVDASCRPHMRWMTPALLQGRPGALFAVTSPRFSKAAQLATHPEAEWMLQSRSLNEVINIKCRVNIVDSPSLKTEVLDVIGKKLTVFWQVNEQTDFIILETVIEEATYICPMKNLREVVHFDRQVES